MVLNHSQTRRHVITGFHAFYLDNRFGKFIFLTAYNTLRCCFIDMVFLACCYKPRQCFLLISFFLCISFLLIDFSLTVKSATLTFISGRGSAISSAKEGKSGFIYNLVKS